LSLCRKFHTSLKTSTRGIAEADYIRDDSIKILVAGGLFRRSLSHLKTPARAAYRELRGISPDRPEPPACPVMACSSMDCRKNYRHDG
jgi:hypothetical protein